MDRVKRSRGGTMTRARGKGKAVKHFNSLTPSEAERLAMLAEEAGEIVQAIGKILRHGYTSCHPDGGIDNRDSLRSEVIDLLGVVHMMRRAGDLDVRVYTGGQMVESSDRKLAYSHHQGVPKSVPIPRKRRAK